MPNVMASLIVMLCVAVVVVCVVVVLLRYFAQRVIGLVLPPSFIPVLDWRPEEALVTLPLTPHTRRAGTYGAWWDNRHHHAQIGDVITVDEQAFTVVRELVTPYDTARPEKIEWGGQVYRSPFDLDIPFSEQLLSSNGQSFPAWHFPGTGTDWVIHVHGLRAGRLSPLRGVPVFHELGYHSVVVSYRGDPVNGHPSAFGSSTLGVDEWPIMDAAIEYALAHGAKRVLLMGWSMGGGMVLLANERAVHKAAVDGLILVAPTTNWTEVILYGARQANVPALLGKAVIAALNNPFMSRVLGADSAIDFASLDWTTTPGRLSTPTLVLHSPGDTEVPLHLSQTLATQNTNVTISEIPDTDHTLEWNRDRAMVETAIRSWESGL